MCGGSELKSRGLICLLQKCQDSIAFRECRGHCPLLLPRSAVRERHKTEDRKSRKRCEERHVSMFDIVKAPTERKMNSTKEQTHSCPAEDRKIGEAPTCTAPPIEGCGL